MRRVIEVALVCLVGSAGIGGCAGDLDDAVGREIRKRVSAEKPPSSESGASWDLIRQVYRDREERPLWSGRGRPLARAKELVTSICRAGKEGFRPADYDVEGLRQAALALESKQEPGPDDHRRARHQAHRDDARVRERPARGPAGSQGGGRRVVPALAALEHRQHAASGISGRWLPGHAGVAWSPAEGVSGPRRGARRNTGSCFGTEDGDRCHQARRSERGDRGPRVAALRERLRASGELDAPKDAEPVFDDEVAGAVARFQARHGLEPDSSVGGATLSALNVPVERRIRQIELNLDRYRWLPDEFADRYMLVNIPDFRLRAYDGGKEELRAAGDRGRRVPERYAGVRRLDDVSGLPPGVERPLQHPGERDAAEAPGRHLRSRLARLRGGGYPGRTLVRDPSSIDWDDVDSVDLRYRVRQRSGENNSLGLVKFMFPNRFNIYLHDTPSRKLFDRPVRTLSHGCVRVEDPVQLADFVLDGQEGWDEGKIRAAMEDSKAKRGRMVSLERPVPVYLLYLTAFMRDGELHFRNDPYGKDRRAMRQAGQAPAGGAADLRGARPAPRRIVCCRCGAGWRPPRCS